MNPLMQTEQAGHIVTSIIPLVALAAGMVVIRRRSNSLLTGASKTAEICRRAFALICLSVLLGLSIHFFEAGLACPGFPICKDGFFPNLSDGMQWLAFGHRWVGVAAGLVSFHGAVTGLNETGKQAEKLFRGIGAVAAAEIILGIGTVLSSLHPRTRAMHAVSGYLLFLLVFAACRRTRA